MGTNRERKGISKYLHERTDRYVEDSRIYFDLPKGETTYRLPRWDNKPPFVKMDNLDGGYVIGHVLQWLVPRKAIPTIAKLLGKGKRKK